jgi:hypothetical protein
MRTIWKFMLEPTRLNRIEMPENAKILIAAEQYGEICIWAEVNTDSQKSVRLFEVFGTGHEMDDVHREYIGTAMLSVGSLVFHVYERSWI